MWIGICCTMPLAAIGTKHGFNRDLVAGTSFGHVGAGALQAGPAAFADEVEIKCTP